MNNSELMLALEARFKLYQDRQNKALYHTKHAELIRRTRVFADKSEDKAKEEERLANTAEQEAAGDKESAEKLLVEAIKRPALKKRKKVKLIRIELAL